ncbi:MAG: RnfH family protein [Alteromonadaceae bacterium]|nr:RnfH family protein [Alteromonadaceae bacterium]
MDNLINVEVAYATPEKQSLIELTVPAGSTAEQAIVASGVMDIHPEINLPDAKVGIWNRVCKPSAEVQEGDRIEVYRPLIADPKEVRKRRAEKAIQEGRADKVTGGRPNQPKASAQKPS